MLRGVGAVDETAIQKRVTKQLLQRISNQEAARRKQVAAAKTKMVYPVPSNRSMISSCCRIEWKRQRIRIADW